MTVLRRFSQKIIRLINFFTLSQKRVETNFHFYTHNKMVGSPPYMFIFSFRVAKHIKIRLYTPQLCAGQLHKVEASLHCPNTAAPHPQVSFPYGNCEQKCKKKFTLGFSKTILIEDTNILHPLLDRRQHIFCASAKPCKDLIPHLTSFLPSFLSSFKAPSISQAPRIEPCGIGLCSQALYRQNSYFY